MFNLAYIFGSQRLVRLATMLLVALSICACGDPGGELPASDANPGIDDNASDLISEDSADEVTSGHVLYAQQCASCHKSDGAGTSAGPALVGCSNCSNASALAASIDATMPLGSPNRCDAACSAQIAGYIIAEFNAPAPIVDATQDVGESPSNPEESGDADLNTHVIDAAPDAANSDLQKQTYDRQCSVCHGVDGAGGGSGVPLLKCNSCSDRNTLMQRISTSMPLGNPAACQGACPFDMADYILATLNASVPQSVSSVLDVQLLSPPATLRRAALSLAGRLPTTAELAMVTNDGELRLDAALDRIVNDEGFYDRLMEIYNDKLLTDRYRNYEAAINLLADDEYPARRWYRNLGLDAKSVEDLKNKANDAVAREPLQLIAHIARENRPFSEILTADYRMVNPFSAKSFGVDTQVAFVNYDDVNEYREARLPGARHAGILTSPMFLNRFTTTATNRDRTRARMVFEIFLDTDILKMDGQRPLSAETMRIDAPTLSDSNCVVCHQTLDPVASAFRDWSWRGQFRPVGSWWNVDMASAGFSGRPVPPEQNARDLPWLAQQIVVDRRFARSVVKILYSGIIGQHPLTPTESANANESAAINEQRTVLSMLEQEFIDSNYDIKRLAKSVVKTTYFRASALRASAETAVHRSTGADHLLTPEQLERKIRAVFGKPWVRWGYNVFRETQMNTLYGGIDSDAITQRVTQPNGIMSAVQKRMATELSCSAVMEDFARNADRRRLLVGINMDVMPEDPSGANIPANVAKIKTALKSLHNRILGEELADTDPELAESYQLFIDVWRQGKALIANDRRNEWIAYRCRVDHDPDTGQALGSNSISRDPNYVARAWMAVTMYLIADYRFVYQ